MYQIDIFQNHFKSIFPEIFLSLGTTVLLVYAVIYNSMAYYKFPILTSVLGWLSIQVLAITIWLITNQSIPFATLVILNNVLIIDDFSTIIKIIILASAFASILISLDYIKKQRINSFEYMILILFSTLSMLFIVSSYDLISVYLGIELQSLSFYVLASFQRNDEFSTEAGLKYFVLGALSSGLLLFGESILYGFTGITNFEEFAKFSPWAAEGHSSLQAASDTLYKDSFGNVFASGIACNDFAFGNGNIFGTASAVAIGLLFVIVACLFKISAVPFHMWTPDVYEGAPTSVTAFFAITPKVAVLALLLRLCLYTFFDLIETWRYIIIFSAFLSILIGTLGALNQKKIKRLFAFSSIAHVGYILIGFAAASIEAIEGVLIYILLYIPILIGTFGTLLTASRHQVQVDDSLGNMGSQPSMGPVTSGPVYKSNQSHLCPQGNKAPDGTDSSLPSAVSESGRGSFSGRNLTLWEEKCLKASHPIWNNYAWMPDTLTTPSGTSNLTPIAGLNSFPYGKHVKKKESYIKYITDLASLSKGNRLLAITMAILLFSNAGVPPLAGFYGKVNVFLVAVESSMYFLAIAGVLCSVLGAFYSIRLVKIIYFHGLGYGINKWTWYKQINKLSSIILGITFLFTLFFFLFPSFLFTLTHLGALSLCL